MDKIFIFLALLLLATVLIVILIFVERAKIEPVTKLPIGSSCTSGTDCLSTICSLGVCVGRLGSKCSSSKDCFTGDCINGVCQTEGCSPGTFGCSPILGISGNGSCNVGLEVYTNNGKNICKIAQGQPSNSPDDCSSRGLVTLTGKTVCATKLEEKSVCTTSGTLCKEGQCYPPSPGGGITGICLSGTPQMNGGYCDTNNYPCNEKNYLCNTTNNVCETITEGKGFGESCLLSNSVDPCETGGDNSYQLTCVSIDPNGTVGSRGICLSQISFSEPPASKLLRNAYYSNGGITGALCISANTPKGYQCWTNNNKPVILTPPNFPCSIGDVIVGGDSCKFGDFLQFYKFVDGTWVPLKYKDHGIYFSLGTSIYNITSTLDSSGESVLAVMAGGASVIVFLTDSNVLLNDKEYVITDPMPPTNGEQPTNDSINVEDVVVSNSTNGINNLNLHSLSSYWSYIISQIDPESTDPKITLNGLLHTPVSSLVGFEDIQSIFSDTQTGWYYPLQSNSTTWDVSNQYFPNYDNIGPYNKVPSYVLISGPASYETVNAVNKLVCISHNSNSSKDSVLVWYSRTNPDVDDFSNYFSSRWYTKKNKPYFRVDGVKFWGCRSRDFLALNSAPDDIGYSIVVFRQTANNDMDLGSCVWMYIHFPLINSSTRIIKIAVTYNSSISDISDSNNSQNYILYGDSPIDHDGKTAESANNSYMKIAILYLTSDDYCKIMIWDSRINGPASKTTYGTTDTSQINPILQNEYGKGITDSTLGQKVPRLPYFNYTQTVPGSGASAYFDDQPNDKGTVMTNNWYEVPGQFKATDNICFSKGELIAISRTDKYYTELSVQPISQIG